MNVKWSKNNIVFIKDESVDFKKIDDPHIVEAYIPEEYNLKTSGKGLQLTKRNELRHPVGIVAARSLRYFSTNGEGFNIFRTRGMAVWWLRHIFNSFNWWKAYVVNAEGERKGMPMLYIGEKFGSATGHQDNEADIVISAFENDQCIVNPESKGGAIFAVGYSERGGLFNSPDMYGVKTIVGNKYKGAGVKVTNGITRNLRLMSVHALKNNGKEITEQNLCDEIKKMKVVVLDRPRHKKLINTLISLSVQIILVKDDDLTPTFAIIRGEVDLIIGVGGIPEAILSAIIIEKLGGEMSLRILPMEVALDERLSGSLSNWELFKKNEIDILRCFKIVKPGAENKGEVPWNTVWTSRDLAKDCDMVFTASVIKKNPWIKFQDGEAVPGIEVDHQTGDITVHVIRIADNNMEIIPVIYTTVIKEYLKLYNKKNGENGRKRGELLLQLSRAYAEFGMFRDAKECLQKIKICGKQGNDLSKRCDSIYEYYEGLDALTNKPILIPEVVIKHFEKVCYLDKEDNAGLRSKNMIKRFYEYLGDKYYHNREHEKAITYYKEALKYSPHELKLYRKVNSIQMRNILGEYFNRIDRRFKEFGDKESIDWKRYKLGIALEVFYNNEKRFDLSSKEPWLIFFRRTVLHGEKPSYKLAILIKLLWLYKKLNQANDPELSKFLNKEFKISKEDINSIIKYRKIHERFQSIGELYYVNELSLEGISNLLLPQVRVESQNELEDADLPLSISFVEAMERRYKNILEELKEGYKEEAQEHTYAVAEAYHYVGLALHDIGDDEGTKIYYDMAIMKFREIIEKFEGITPVNAQFRIGNLYEELALLFEDEQIDYCNKAVDAYMCIIDEQRSTQLFGNIRELIPIRIQHANERVVFIKSEFFLG